jgi:hypothetical protein
LITSAPVDNAPRVPDDPLEDRSVKPTLTRRAFLTIAGVALGAVGGLSVKATSSHGSVGDQRIALGNLTLLVHADPWQLTLLDPAGGVVWREAPDAPIGYRTSDGRTVRARRLSSIQSIGPGAVQLIAETDDADGSAIAVEARQISQFSFRLIVTPNSASDVASVGGSFLTMDSERFVGLGERFDSVNQRGKVVDVWADDRRLAGYGPSTYAPIPLLLSSAGYSIALDRFERAQFDLAASMPDRWSWQQQAG